MRMPIPPALEFDIPWGRIMRQAPTYNDVDDYNGYSETAPTFKAGVALTGFLVGGGTVKVEFFDPGELAVATSDKGLKRITVTVTSPTNKTTNSSLCGRSMACTNTRLHPDRL